MYQVEMVCLNQVVDQGHRYRSFIKVWDFKTVNQMLLVVRKKNPYEGYGIERLFELHPSHPAVLLVVQVGLCELQALMPSPSHHRALP